MKNFSTSTKRTFMLFCIGCFFVGIFIGALVAYKQLKSGDKEISKTVHAH